MGEAAFLGPENLQFQVHATDWENALKLAAKPLVGGGCIDESYVQAMIDSVHELGPYIVIAPGLALGHARPSAAVHRPCLAIATLDAPVEFESKQNDPVDIVVVLASTSNDAHLALLQKVVKFLGSKESFDALRKARTPEDAQAIVDFVNGGE